MTRNGKIARLPRCLRDQLNQRLDDGEPGSQVLAWLNERPVVREILNLYFDGRPINEQNLSEWRQGGLRDWQRQQEACAHVRRLADQAEAVDETAENTNVTDRLATVLAVELFKVLEQLLENTEGDQEKKLSYLREGLREVRFLRRGDHNAMRLQMERERREREWEIENEEYAEQLKEKSRKRMLGLFLSKTGVGTMAEMFGGGEHGREMADMLTRIKFDLPFPDKPKPAEAKSPQATPAVDIHETETKAEPRGSLGNNQGESN